MLGGKRDYKRYILELRRIHQWFQSPFLEDDLFLS